MEGDREGVRWSQRRVEYSVGSEGELRSMRRKARRERKTEEDEVDCEERMEEGSA